MKCHHCGFANEVGSRFCTKCAAPIVPPQNGQTQKWLLGIFISICVLGGWAIIASIVGDANRFKSQAPTTAQLEAAFPDNRTSPAAAPPSAATASAWQYSDYADAMSDQRTKAAYVESLNTINFAFPYSGEQHARLTLRKRRGSDNVILKIEKGQLTCGDYYGRSVSVRFDDKPPRRFSVSESADHDSTVVFIRGEKSFIAELKKSKLVFIEAIVYQNGSPIFLFDTAGLKW